MAIRDEARAAADKREARKASRAADRAYKAARAVHCAPGPDAPQEGVCGEVAQLAHETREIAEEAREVEQLHKLTSSLKAKGYRLARNTAVTGTFRGLALAAERAEGYRVQALPESLRGPALSACSLADARLPGGECDWAKAARSMRDAAEASEQSALLLAIGLTVARRPELALIEIESLERSCPAGAPLIALNTNDCRLVIAALRSIILSENDLPRLARKELASLSLESSGISSSEIGAWVHLFMAIQYMSEKRYAPADEELARAIRLAPGATITVFVTGERPLAGGAYQRESGSLEDAAQGTGLEDVAATLAQRARSVRDGRATEPIVLDKWVIAEVALVCLRAEAWRSPEAARLLRAIEDSRAFVQGFLAKIPGMGRAPAAS